MITDMFVTYLLIVSHLFSLIIHNSDSQHQLLCIIIIKYNIQIISKSSCYLLSNLKQWNIFGELLMIVSSCVELRQLLIATISFDFKLTNLYIQLYYRLKLFTWCEGDATLNSNTMLCRQRNRGNLSPVKEATNYSWMYETAALVNVTHTCSMVSFLSVILFLSSSILSNHGDILDISKSGIS